MKRLLAAGLFLFLIANAPAFELLNPTIETTWAPSQVQFYLDLGNYNNVALTKLATWSQYMGRTSLVGHDAIAPPVWGNGRNDIAFSADEHLNFNWPSNVLAITLPNFDWTTGRMIETDIVFNSAFTFGSYDGPSQGSYDIGRILLHEIGHSIGLGHSLAFAIMDPSPSDLDHLTADDIAGVQFLYQQERNAPDSGTTGAMLAMGLLFCLGLRRLA